VAESELPDEVEVRQGGSVYVRQAGVSLYMCELRITGILGSSCCGSLTSTCGRSGTSRRKREVPPQRPDEREKVLSVKVFADVFRQKPLPVVAAFMEVVSLGDAVYLCVHLGKL
jgi:hypothetical protein